MQSEHRHQLEQHDLRAISARAIPWFERHGKQLVIGVAVAVALIVGIAIWWNVSYDQHAAAWSQLATASTVDEFGSVADKYPDTLAAAWANLRTGELNYESGVQAMYRDRELGLTDLKSSQASFEKVLSSSVALPDNLRERAMLGVARVMEATSDGDTEPVVEAYQKLLTRSPNSIYKPMVEKKIKELQSGGAREFYAWFHAQKPKPAAFPRPNDGRPEGTMTTPGAHPFELPPPATTTNPAAPETPSTPVETPAPAGSTSIPADSAPAETTTPATATSPQTDSQPAPASAPAPAATPAPAGPANE